MKYSEVDVALLPALAALVEEASVTRAAKRLGLSVPATSHALARLRDRLGDPILVRAGRAMVRTPRAEAMRDDVREAMAAAGRVLARVAPLDPKRLDRVFHLHATDHVLLVLGPAFDRLLANEAPRVRVRFLPNAPDDAAALRDGRIDLAIGVYDGLPPEIRTRTLFEDRLVCVLRDGHPALRRELTLDRFAELEHVQIAPRGRSGGIIEELLAARGRTRRVARAVPYFVAALGLAAESDYVVTVSERIARVLAPRFGLRIVDAPLPLEPYPLDAIWHPRMDGDAAHAFLRDVLVRAARASGPLPVGARRGHHHGPRGSARRTR